MGQTWQLHWLKESKKKKKNNTRDHFKIFSGYKCTMANKSWINIWFQSTLFAQLKKDFGLKRLNFYYIHRVSTRTTLIGTPSLRLVQAVSQSRGAENHTSWASSDIKPIKRQDGGERALWSSSPILPVACLLVCLNIPEPDDILWSLHKKGWKKPHPVLQTKTPCCWEKSNPNSQTGSS